MPLPFDLASLITNYTAPASSRVDPQTLQRMQFEHGKKQDAAQNERQDAYLRMQQGDRDYGRDQDAWDKLREAVISGDPELMALAQSSLQQRGIAVDYGAVAKGKPASVARETSRSSPIADGLFGGAATSQERASVQQKPQTAQEQEAGFLGDIESGEIGNPRAYAVEPEKIELEEDAPPKSSVAGELSRSMGLPSIGEQKQGPGRFSVRDRSGKVVMEADMGQIVAARQQRVGEVFDGYIAQAGDDDEKAAATAAKSIAQKALAAGHSMKEAVALGIQEYNRQVDPYRKAMIGTEIAKARGQYRYGTGGGGGGGGEPALGGGGMTPGLADKMDDNVRANVNRVRMELGQWFPQAELALGRASKFIDSPDPAQQRQAINELIKSMSGATVSDRERGVYDNMAGALSALQGKINTFIAGGAIDPDLIRGIKGILLETRAGILRTRIAAGNDAYQSTLGSVLLQYLTPEQREFQARLARSGITGEKVGEMPGMSGSGGGGKAPAPPKAPSKASPRGGKTPDQIVEGMK